jgi:hypothetical protein
MCIYIHIYMYRDWKAVADHFDIFVFNKGAHHVNIDIFQEDLMLTADWLKTYIEGICMYLYIYI